MAPGDRQRAPSAWRSFLAVPVPPDAAGRLVDRLAPYRERHPRARWLPAPSLHLTLLFLGSVEPRWLDDLSRLVGRVAGFASPFEVRTGHGSGRLRGRDAVAWLALDRGAAEVSRLADELTAGLPVGLLPRGRSPRRSPAPHLTIARRADGPLLEDLASGLAGPLGVAWQADRIALLRSFLERPGARYDTVAEAHLGVAP